MARPVGHVQVRDDDIDPFSQVGLHRFPAVPGEEEIVTGVLEWDSVDEAIFLVVVDDQDFCHDATRATRDGSFSNA